MGEERKETIGLNGTPSLCTFGRPYIKGVFPLDECIDSTKSQKKKFTELLFF